MLIDGKKIAEEILVELKKKISDKNLELSLGAVLVGEDPEFKKFVEFKGRAAEKVGASFTIYHFPENIESEELKKNIQEISKWSNGILIELPLPKGINQQDVLNTVAVNQDVDVLSDDAQKLFYEDKSRINPPAVEALKIVVDKQGIELKGKKVAVFGQGILIGKPISHWLEGQGANVSRIRSTTKNPKELALEADVIISGVGKPELITGDMVKEGSIVIDFGYGKIKNKMAGDVELKGVAKKASLITPVPGGMGPILISAVIKNLVTLNEN